MADDPHLRVRPRELLQEDQIIHGHGAEAENVDALGHTLTSA